MLDKKGYLRTMEVFLAFVATFIFVIYMMPSYISGDTPSESINLLTPLADNIRNCENVSCIKEIINNFDSDFAGKYAYEIDMGFNSSEIINNLPRKDIYIDSVYLTGNITDYNPRIIKLYYWKR